MKFCNTSRIMSAALNVTRVEYRISLSVQQSICEMSVVLLLHKAEIDPLSIHHGDGRSEPERFI